MVTQEQRRRVFYWKDSKGEMQSIGINYTVIKKDDQLLNVINQNGFSVEKNSENWEYFKNQ